MILTWNYVLMSWGNLPVKNWPILYVPGARGLEHWKRLGACMWWVQEMDRKADYLGHINIFRSADPSISTSMDHGILVSLHLWIHRSHYLHIHRSMDSWMSTTWDHWMFVCQHPGILRSLYLHVHRSSDPIMSTSLDPWSLVSLHLWILGSWHLYIPR